jgi:hypothetical protein
MENTKDDVEAEQKSVPWRRRCTTTKRGWIGSHARDILGHFSDIHPKADGTRQ